VTFGAPQAAMPARASARESGRRMGVTEAIISPVEQSRDGQLAGDLRSACRRHCAVPAPCTVRSLNSADGPGARDHRQDRARTGPAYAPS
jgi:hypothetical protein